MFTKSDSNKAVLHVFTFFILGYLIPITLYAVGFVGLNMYEIIKPIHFLIFCFISILSYSIIVGLLFFLYGLRKKLGKEDIYSKIKQTFYESIVFYVILYLMGIAVLTIAVDNLMLTTFAPNLKPNNYLIGISATCAIVMAVYLVLKNIKKLKTIWESRILTASAIVVIAFVFNNTVVGRFFSQDFLDKEAAIKVAFNYKNRDVNETEKNAKNFMDDFIVEDKQLQKNADGYLYTLPKDNKLRVEIDASKTSIKKVVLDGQDLLLDINATNTEIARTDYEIKPGTYNLQIIGVTENGIDFNATKKIIAQYVYDASKQVDGVLDSWYMKDSAFATVTKDGILLYNKKLTFDSFGYKRRFDGDVSFEFEFTPINTKNIDMSVYVGERTYVIFDNRYIKLFQKLKNGKNKLQKKVEYKKFSEDTKYKIKATRHGDRYKIYVNDFEMLIFDDMHDGDVVVAERYKNIGVTLPKNSMKILISRIVIE